MRGRGISTTAEDDMWIWTTSSCKSTDALRSYSDLTPSVAFPPDDGLFPAMTCVMSW